MERRFMGVFPWEVLWVSLSSSYGFWGINLIASSRDEARENAPGTPREGQLQQSWAAKFGWSIGA